MIKLHFLSVVVLGILAGKLGALAVEQPRLSEGENTRRHVTFQWGPQLNLRLPMNGSYVSSSKHGNGELGYGIGAGLYGRMLITSRWYMASGISFNYDAMPITLNPFHSQGGAPEWHKYHLDSMVAEIPLDFGYRFPFARDDHFSVFLGVSGSYYLTSGISGGTAESARYKAFGADGIFKRSSLNVDFGMTIEVEDKALVSVGGKFGMVNIAKKDIFAYRDMYYASVTIGVVFFL